MPSVRATGGRRRRTLDAAAALALVACLVSSCGEDSNTDLSQDRASDLRSALDRVEQGVADGDCTAAAQRAGEFRQQVASLPERVDRDLRSALEGSATRLESLVSQQCEPAPVEEAPTQDAPVPDQNQQDQEDSGKKEKKPKEQKGTTGDEGSTGVTGPEGSTGATGQDGGVTAPEGGG
jgi:hypothetical protein